MKIKYIQQGVFALHFRKLKVCNEEICFVFSIRNILLSCKLVMNHVVLNKLSIDGWAQRMITCIHILLNFAVNF